MTDFPEAARVAPIVDCHDFLVSEAPDSRLVETQSAAYIEAIEPPDRSPP
jgi:hypothetical protein